MRTAFINTLCEMAEITPNLVLLTADLGFSVLETFAERFPDRYINVGVAEQNMTGLAAGLAMSGKKIFTYSIANFPTLRCLEQIRNDVCYHDGDVKIVAVGGGYTYGSQGYTHHGVEDLAVMSALMGMTVLAPGDPHEAMACTRLLADTKGPAYLRLGRGGEPDVHSSPFQARFGGSSQLREGTDITLLSTGGMLKSAMEAAEQLATEHDIQARVVSLYSFQPIDEAAILAAARETGGILTLEEHHVTCGLGARVGDLLASNGLAVPFRKIGARPEMRHIIGSQSYMRAQMGDIIKTARLILEPQR